MKNVFDRTTTYDSVAQLGERHLDRVEVAGSSPVGIITTPSSLRELGVFCCIQHLFPTGANV